jgi:8-oxo-dGTP pyrophosphatase MutT (NUDIX family)
MVEASIVTAICARLTSALTLPRDPLRPLEVDGHAAGWLDATRAARLRAFDDVFSVDDRAVRFRPSLADAQSRTAAMDRVTRELAAEGALTAWRDERYAVAPDFGAPPWFVLERAAARYFGVRTFAVHVNGLVEEAGAASMWFARRSAAKPIDPGMLDNLVGGGISAGESVAGTVVKESWEEAGIGSDVASRATPEGTVGIRRVQADGLQLETIFVHDLWLPAAFVPANQDGEAVSHRLVDLGGAAQLIANASGDDAVTIDASLVVLDCLMRHGALAGDARDITALVALLRSPPSPAD